MKSLIRTVFALLFLALAFNTGFAGNGSVRPINQFAGVSKFSIQSVDSFLLISLHILSLPAESGTGYYSTRICSCQILNLESANYDHRHIALFAEKANHGSSSDFRAARNRIEREKKQLRRMFYDKVKVVAEVSGAGSCHSMYVKLKSGDGSLQIYEILNADIR